MHENMQNFLTKGAQYYIIKIGRFCEIGKKIYFDTEKRTDYVADVKKNSKEMSF